MDNSKPIRSTDINRDTAETQIRLRLELDGAGKYEIKTGCGFLDHMLELFARHGRFNLFAGCTGDTHVDYHHTVEDVGIVLGQAFAQSLGDKRGITRYGSFLLPMDEALVQIALDISGRPHLVYNVNIPSRKVGDLDTELIEEFLLGFVRSLGVTLHVNMISGENSHHIIEAIFKGLGRALAQAVAIDPRIGGEIPSTKGVL